VCWSGARPCIAAVLLIIPALTPGLWAQGAFEGLNDVAITCDSRVVLGAEDRAVRVWDVKTERLINRALTGHAGKVGGLACLLVYAGLMPPPNRAPPRDVRPL